MINFHNLSSSYFCSPPHLFQLLCPTLITRKQNNVRLLRGAYKVQKDIMVLLPDGVVLSGKSAGMVGQAFSSHKRRPAYTFLQQSDNRSPTISR